MSAFSNRRLTVAMFAVAGAFFIACNDAPTDPIVCTEEFRFGLSIRVLDGATGAGAAEGARGTITEGDYVEELQVFGNDGMFGAGERAGTYDIRITKQGYEEWTASQVTVTADECHVHTVSLQANLVPLP